MITLIFITRKSIKYEDEDVWLNIRALAAIFNVDRSGIVRQINNIYKEDELRENNTCAKIAHMGNDGKQTYKTKYYNLDMIISIGFIVNSKKVIKFGTLANKVIKDYNTLRVFHYDILEGKDKTS